MDRKYDIKSEHQYYSGEYSIRTISNNNLEFWMTRLPKSLKNVSIIYLAIPGKFKYFLCLYNIDKNYFDSFIYDFVILYTILFLLYIYVLYSITYTYVCVCTYIYKNMEKQIY